MALRDEPKAYPVERSIERFHGHVISLRTDFVVFDDDTIDRDVVEHPGAVGIIAVDDHERVLLLQQYRHPPGRLLWEPPAGLLDEPGEPPLVTAQRELAEEAGYRAGRWDVLVDAFTSPGISSEAIRIYLARDLVEIPSDERYVGQHEERDMPTRWVAMSEVVESVFAGDLHNPLLIMGVLAGARAQVDGFTRLRPADTGWPERDRRSPSGA